MVTFRREDRVRVAAGEITVTFRLWKSAKVKAGTTYRTSIGALHVEDVSVIPAGLISKRDVKPSGCRDIRAIWDLAGEHTGASVGPDTMLFRMQFRYLGDVAPEPPRAALDRSELAERLGKMDRLSQRGAWTLAVLRLIDSAPHVPARLLAAELGWETLVFKAHVRRLKALGLTISHEVGYELSDLGRALLSAPRATSTSAKHARRRARRP